MLDDPRNEIGDVIRWSASRKKIFNVHFRNISGRPLDFMDVFPDEGDMDMPATLRNYKECGYEYMAMPDRVPHVTAADERQTAFAFAFGYIRVMRAIGA